VPLEKSATLDVTWSASYFNGGAEIDGYEIEWFSKEQNNEIQKVTTSASNEITEIQSIRTTADKNNIGGFFILTFKGEVTELISVNAEADGPLSVESRLRRLTTIGEISVERKLSKMLALQGNCFLFKQVHV
jgi:hypothetical protein